MTKLFTVIAMLVTVTSAANASYVCAVSAENPNQPGVYDQLLKLYDGEIAYLTDAFLYLHGNTRVMASINEDGSLQLASFQKGMLKIDALALAKADSLSLIDGKNGLSIVCQKK